MRKWGIVISVFYAVVVIGFLLPAAILITGDEFPVLSNLFGNMRGALRDWLTWIPIVIVVSSQALLLFLSVDTSQKRLKPRTHILVSTIVTALLLALLSFAGIFSLGVGIRSDKFLDFLDQDAASGAIVLGACTFLWLFWGVVFYLFVRNSSEWITRATSWLLKGSVLELLIAVPCHVIVRRRHDCSAPIATSFGITAGIAIMLLSFGPSVLFLFKKRMEANAPRGRATP
jgi:hypothetical protein